MKKGFTLIEMLGIIAILSIVLLISFPNVNIALKKMKENTVNNFTDNLKISAETYVELNREKYPELDTTGGSIGIKIQQLYDANLLKDVDNTINRDSIVVVTRQSDNTLKYFYNGQEIGVELERNSNPEIANIIKSEAVLIKNNISVNMSDGVYYYNELGNLENGSNIIYLTHEWNNIRGNILIHNNQLISGCIQYNDKNYDYYKGTVTELNNYPCSTVRGENLVVNGDMSYKSNANFIGATYNTNGYLTTTSSSRGNVYNNFYNIPIDTTKSYEFGMTAKTNNQNATHYAGFYSYDIDKKLISSNNVLYISNTLTTLAKDLNNGDEYVYLTNMTNWNKTATQTYQRGIIFWNYVDSTGYQYPELTYSRNIWNNLYTNDNIDASNNRIKLTSPWNHGTFKAGTKLSQCNDGSMYNYNLKANTSIPNTFTNYTSTVTGINNSSSVVYNKFRYGTRYVKWFIFANYNAQSNVTTDIKDIFIREVVN